MRRVIDYIFTVTVAFMVAIGAAAIFTYSVNAHAYTVDPFIGHTGVLGSPADESQWVQTTLGDPSVNWVVSVHNVPYQATPNPFIYTATLLTHPDYFIIKNGIFAGLFENVGDLSLAVFDVQLFPSWARLPSSGFSISHVTELVASDEGGGHGGGIQNISEPPLLALLLAAGVVVVGRRKWA